MRGHCPRFDQGAEVRFGIVDISKRGISIALPGNAPVKLAWSKIARYRIEFGSLVVETQDRTHMRLPTSRIPNLSVLLHVFEQLVARKDLRTKELPA
jgi:hypothetical protein